MSDEEEIRQALERGWPCDYCHTPLAADNVEFHAGKSDIICHTTCYAQVRARMDEFGPAWGLDGWKATPPEESP